MEEFYKAIADCLTAAGFLCSYDDCRLVVCGVNFVGYRSRGRQIRFMSRRFTWPYDMELAVREVVQALPGELAKAQRRKTKDEFKTSLAELCKGQKETWLHGTNGYKRSEGIVVSSSEHGLTAHITMADAVKLMVMLDMVEEQWMS